MEKKDFKTMIFFYEKCLEIARIAKDQACEMRVLSKIGLGYHTLKELEKAREYQELHVALAQEILEEPFQRDAFIQLGKVYLDLANDLEKAPKLEESIQFYKKFLEVCTHSRRSCSPFERDPTHEIYQNS
jgi:tetratricopeptide (TPR) repeat protein